MQDGEGLSSNSFKDTIKMSANTQDFSGATLKVGNMHLQHPINHPTRGRTNSKLQLRLPQHQRSLSKICLLQLWLRQIDKQSTMIKNLTYSTNNESNDPKYANIY